MRDSRGARRQLVADLQDRGITDPRVLAAFRAVPRERFVPEAMRGRAYQDRPLPIGHGATISQPYVVALMLELARLTPDSRVLDVGTGSGYAAALTSRIAAEVVSIERVPELASTARSVLDEFGSDVEVVVGDGHRGWPQGAPYDAIVVAAAATEVPAALAEQLADGGRLVLPVGRAGGVQELVVVERRGDELQRRDVGGVRFVPLVADSE